MADNHMGDEGVKMMSEVLKVNTSLISINLGCEEEQKKGKYEKGKANNHMTGNEIGTEGAKALCEMLKVNSTLTFLDLFCEEEGKRETERVTI